jgi:hypothetical protein
LGDDRDYNQVMAFVARIVIERAQVQSTPLKVCREHRDLNISVQMLPGAGQAAKQIQI